MMTKAAERLAAQMTVHLVPNEEVLAIALVEHRGAARMLDSLAGGLAGVATVEALPGPPQGTACFVPLSGKAVWTLTNRRMMFCKATLINRVGAPLSSIPLRQVEGVGARRTKLGGKLDLVFTDGTAMEIDLLSAREAEPISQAARQLFASPSTSRAT